MFDAQRTMNVKYCKRAHTVFLVAKGVRILYVVLYVFVIWIAKDTKL